VLKGRREAAALPGIVAQPVQELGKAPLGRVDAAAPVDGFEAPFTGRGGDLAGFLPRAMIAPEIVVVDGLEMRITGIMVEPVVSSAMASMALPSIEAFSMARRMASASACMWLEWLWVA